MRALRRLNNNAVVCVDSRGREIIALGKGVGFGDLPRELRLEEIERTFYDLDGSSENIMRDLPAEVVVFAAQIIEIGENKLPYAFSPNAVLLLADHIAFAIDRTRKQLNVRMPLAYDVKQNYPMEYHIGEYTVRRVRREFGVELPWDEAAGIALNLVNAKAVSKTKTEKKQSVDEMVEDVTEIVENFFHIIVNRDSFNFTRYATHLQYLLQRVRRQERISSENLRLYNSLREEFPEVSACVEQISLHVKAKWGCVFSEEEKLYLILHVNRIRAKEEP